MKQAWVFPGQGSQAVGMGKAMAEAFACARAVFQEVDDALGEPLSRLIFEGPQESLTLTENAQPAIMATSIAILKVMEQEAGLTLARDAAYVAGHSLGEYTALCASGALSLAETARLLKIRGTAMQAAVPAGRGAMAALLGLDYAQAAEVAAEAAQGDVCSVANDNAAGQVVVSGAKQAVERALEIAKTKGAKRAVLLAVSAPFHCPLMAPAAGIMEEALSAATLTAPCVPLIANITAEPVTSPEAIRRLLVDQVTGMVRWRESVHTMKSLGVTHVMEIGAGKVLAGLTKRIEPEIDASCIATPQDLDFLLSKAA